MLDLMRRYAFGFVNSHDPAVARQIMRPDYRLNMGHDCLVGRDDAYIPAVLHQMAQFPQLGFSIHELVTDGTMTALSFSEHGRSVRSPGAEATWRGVSIYRVEGEQLAECWVEQDHFGRRRQLADGVVDPVGQVAVDPWSGHEPVPDTERNAGLAAVEQWASTLRVWPPTDASLDAGCAAEAQPRLDVSGAKVHACVVEGQRVAFNATVSGTYRGGLPDLENLDRPVDIHTGAFATVTSTGLENLEGVTNRVAVQRQLRADASTGSIHNREEDGTHVD
ncbi:MAG: ester cyclase [Actinomycetia bacterium]|nr:ester cyclase [Actinomycetes bacterium]